MARHGKTLTLWGQMRGVLEAGHPMTVRQVYYQLVSVHGLKNDLSHYRQVVRALVTARQDGAIPWDWVEDRTRRPRQVSMWPGPPGFAKAASAAYRRNVWPTQDTYLEVWLEKDALSGIFEDVLAPYGVTLQVGRGYDGWASIHKAAGRYTGYEAGGWAVTVLYFGDFDPTGEDIVRSLRERLGYFGCCAEVILCALTPTDITRYNLPPALTKRTDSRRRGFVARHGDLSVELDALPPEVLRGRLVAEVEARLDLEELAAVKTQEAEERARLVTALAPWAEA